MRQNGFKREKEKKSKYLFKILTILLLISLISFLGYHFFLALNITNEKLKILDIAQQDVADLRIQNLELVLEKSEIVSLDYLEQEARDKLRYSGEGEVLFVIPEDLLESEWVENELNAAKGNPKVGEEKKTEEIFQIWLDFLFLSGV